MDIKTLGKGLTVITMSDDSFVNERKWRWDRCMYIDFVYKRRQKDLRNVTNKITTVERLYLFLLFFYNYKQTKNVGAAVAWKEIFDADSRTVCNP
jgi:hypothetical protein